MSVPSLDGLLTRAQVDEQLDNLHAVSSEVRVKSRACLRNHDAAMRALTVWACQELCDRIEEKVDKENETSFIYEDLNTWPDYRHAQAALAKVKEGA